VLTLASIRFLAKVRNVAVRRILVASLNKSAGARVDLAAGPGIP
jgi:hypothetical protein